MTRARIEYTVQSIGGDLQVRVINVTSDLVVSPVDLRNFRDAVMHDIPGVVHARIVPIPEGVSDGPLEPRHN